MTIVISPRTLWLAGLVAAGVLITAAVLADVPAGVAGSSLALDDFRRAVGQGQVLAAGAPTIDGIQPLASPLWPLLLARFSNDLAFVARIVGGLSVVLCLFLAYQLCHGLSSPDEANEQSSLALLALALTPGFLLAAASGSSELPHLALLLATTLLIQQALGAEAPLLPMLAAGGLAGLSLLVRPVSILLPVATGIWLWSGRPFSSDERAANLKPGLAFGAAFLVGASPQLLMSFSGHSFPFSWGAAETGAFGARLLADPLRVVAGIYWTVVEYAAGDDLARFDAIQGSWRAGAWGSLIGAMIAMAPTILKLLGGLGLTAICWLERFTAGTERARFPAVLLLLLVVGGALGFVDERGTLPIAALLAVLTFAGLSSLLPGAPGGLLGLALLTFLLLNQVGVGTAPNMAAAYRASDPIAAELHERGVMPRQVMSASWGFYDTRTPWKERYRHIPGYVDSTEALIREMQRQGATHLVFDRRAGAEQWPRLARLLERERPPAGLRPLKPLIQTDESPPNLVAIYTLE